MMLPLVLVIAIGLLLIQLVMGLRISNRHLRILPVYLLGGFELLCIVCFFLGKAFGMEDSLSFPAFILGYIGCYWAAAVVLAWGICTIVKRIQKRRNKFGM